MNAKDIRLRSLLETRIQLQIPIYQRAYDWERKNCKQLYDDIISAGKGEKSHFIGAITYSGREEQPVDVPYYQIIDGQQRITSIMLLLRALKDNDIPGALESRINQLIFNMGEENGSDYHKLVLNEDDDGVFKQIIETGKTNAEGNLAAGFNHFRKWLGTEHTGELVWKGLQRLTAVSILLEENDDAQAIFESMNSTGLDLSPTDLIQNYILMSGKSEWQRRIYRKYWRPMEIQFGELSVDSDRFFWCYLSMRYHMAIHKGSVYKRFKEYMENRDREKEIKEIVRHFGQYVRLINTAQNSNHPLEKAIKYGCDQGTDVANPLFLKVLADHEAGVISDQDAKEIFMLVGSYLLRSRVCGMLTGANKRFPELIGRIEKNRYVDSIGEDLMSKRGEGRFPRDDVFKEELGRVQLYTNKACKYVLTRLNGEHKEMAEPDRLNIEHVMPQNLDDDWRRSLGRNHEEIHEKYVHTIGNLTLTAYNPELGNMPFPKKLVIYKNSMIAMTKDLDNCEKWDEDEIKKRAREFADRAVQIWKYPKAYDGNGKVGKDEQAHDLVLEEDYLEGRNTTELWCALKEDIQKTCLGIVFRMNKHYASFRRPADQDVVGVVVCSLQSLRNSIRVTYNTKINEGVVKPSNFVRDVSNVGHYAPGDLQTTIASIDDVAKVVHHVKDVWNAKSD